MTTRQTFGDRLAPVALGALLASCGGRSPNTAAPAETAPIDVGPVKYDASGTMPCSAGGATFDEACGWRVVRDGTGGAEIWIANIVGETQPAYRVLVFSGGEFTSRDGTPLQVNRDGDMWTVVAADGGHFRFADAVINGG
jgi:hypothetical protein